MSKYELKKKFRNAYNQPIRRTQPIQQINDLRIN